MDSGISAVRNLLYVVLVLAALSVLSSFYVASQLSRNSDELASMRVLLQKQMMGEVLTQSEQLQKHMEDLNQQADGIDGKLKKAQDDFVTRMNVELPRIMDNYVKSRTPNLEKKAEKELEKRGVPTK
jgi:predicted PurR-regulated permease PerM